jgi:signal transduction histidine kinase
MVSRTRAEQRALTVASILGAMLVVGAILDAVLTLHVSGGPFTVRFGTELPTGVSVKFGRGVTNISVQQSGPGSSAWTAYIPVFVGIGSLSLTARHSLLAWRIGFLAALMFSLFNVFPFWSVHSPRLTVELALLLVVFCVAGWRHSRPALWWMFVLMLIPAWLWQGPGIVRPFYIALGLAALTVALDALGASRRATHALEVQSERTELEEARRAVLEERTRIARELHDVVAHHLSLIAVQTETAPFRLADLSPSALGELSSVSNQARDALTDMRRLLGVLRNDGAAERSPQPQLTEVPDLVATNRRAGVEIELTMPEHTENIPTSVGLCAYRIIQEALSNINRHARGTPVTVTVAREGQSLLLKVRNGPAPLASLPAESHRAGQGLAGMRERVAILNGTLSAQSSADGGFLVAAVLPFSPLAETGSA